jgi:hypothetical protein
MSKSRQHADHSDRVTELPAACQASRVDVDFTFNTNHDAPLTTPHSRATVIQTNDRRIWIVADTPDPVAGSITPLHVLPIHDIRLGESPCFVKYRRSRTSEQPVHVLPLVVLPVTRNQRFTTLYAWKQLVETEILESQA